MSVWPSSSTLAASTRLKGVGTPGEVEVLPPGVRCFLAGGSATTVASLSPSSSLSSSLEESELSSTSTAFFSAASSSSSSSSELSSCATQAPSVVSAGAPHVCQTAV